MVNQIEVHPGWLQAEAVAYCKEHNILVEAWSPLGRSTVLENEMLVELAAKYGCSTAQLCIRWVLQHGILPLPKSVHPERMQANADVFGFVIDEADMARIDGLQNIGGAMRDPDDVDF